MCQSGGGYLFVIGVRGLVRRTVVNGCDTRFIRKQVAVAEQRHSDLRDRAPPDAPCGDIECAHHRVMGRGFEGLSRRFEREVKGQAGLPGEALAK
jgi:hypothetical protein